MANSKRRCKSCGNSIRDYVVVNNSAFCSIEVAVKYGYANRNKGAKIVHKEQKKKDAVIKIQTLYRQWMCKSSYQNYLDHFPNAILTLQCFCRCVLSKQKLITLKNIKFEEMRKIKDKSERSDITKVIVKKVRFVKIKLRRNMGLNKKQTAFG